MEQTGLIQFEDKNGDGIIQYRGSGSDRENELTIDRDIMVLANPEFAQLPNWVVGLVAAGGLAAALSTAAGLLLVISTSVAHDLLKKEIYPAISEKGELIAARIAAGMAICIAAYFGINPPGFVEQVVAFAFGLTAASFFPAIIYGYFLDTHEQIRSHKRNGRGNHVHGWLYRLLQIHVSSIQLNRTLVDGHLT